MTLADLLAKALRARRPKPRRPLFDSDRFSARLVIKPLESRTLLSASTMLSLDPTGNLLVTDIGGNHDDVTISSGPTAGTMVITNATSTIDASSIPGARVSDDGHSVELDTSHVGDEIFVNLGDGDDSLTIDLSAGDLGKSVAYDSGSGEDSLTLITSSSTEVITLGEGVDLGNRIETDLGSSLEFDEVARLTVTAGMDDSIVVEDSVGVTTHTTLDAGAIQLNDDLSGEVIGSTALNVAVGSSGEIQDGVNLAASGGTVTVASGTYLGDVVLDKSITLVGANEALNPTDPFVTREANSESTVVGDIHVVTSGPVTIRGLEMEGSIIDPGADLLIENNIITSPGTAIDISGANSAVIKNNIITAGVDGVYGVGVATNVTIEGNTIDADNYGVFVHQVGGAFTAQANTITDAAAFGIEIAAVDGNVQLLGNNVTANAGLVGAGGIYASNLNHASTANVVVRGNTISVDGVGLWLESIGGTIEIGGTGPGELNTITSLSGTGVRIDGNVPGGPVSLIDNVITAGGSGIEFRDGTSDFTAQGNTINAGFEAGILVLNSSGNVIINADNQITVVGASAAIATVLIAGSVTIDDNLISSDNSAFASVQVDGVGGSLSFSGNDVTTASIGLYANNIGGDATVQSNDIGGTGFQGIRVSGALGTTLVDDNTVTDLILGIDVLDSPLVTISNNVVTGSIRGIYAASIADLSFSSNSVTSVAGGTGVVFDALASPMIVDFGTNNSITGGDVGLLMQGAVSFDANNLSLHNLELVDQQVAYIVLTDGALAGQEIDGTGVLYDSPTDPAILGSAVVDREVGFGIEDRITHAIDDGSLGFIRVHTGSVFVTQNSFVAPNTTEASIQRGIDVAVANDTVFVQGGALAYNGNLVIDTPLSLVGPNDAVSALVPGSRVQEATIAGSVTIAAAGNVTITGFTINDSVLNDTPSLINGGPVLVVENNFINTAGVGIDASSSDSAEIRGNAIAAGGNGVLAIDLDSDLIVEENRIDSSGSAGIEGRLLGGSVLVRANEINPLAGGSGVLLSEITGNVTVGGFSASDANLINDAAAGPIAYGILADNVGGTVTIQNNTVREATEMSISVSQFLGNTIVSDNVVTATVAGNNTVQGIHLSNIGFPSSANATLQGNDLQVVGGGVWLESIGGTIEIGGTGPGELNTITSLSGTGVRIDGTVPGGPVSLIDNVITAGGSGIEFRDGTSDFTAQGNTINAGFEAGILVLNSSGNVIINADNQITVVGASAAIATVLIAGSVTIDDNLISSDNSAFASVQVDGVGGSLSFSGNDVTTASIGLYANNIGGDATVQSNDIGGTGFQGIRVSGALGTTLVDDNTVTDLILGIDVLDSPLVTISNNVVTGSIRGIYAASIADLSFSSNSVTSVAGGTGVVFDALASPMIVDFGTNNSITGGDVGLLMQGAVSFDANNLSLHNLELVDQQVAYIVLTDGALAGQEIDGTGVLYDSPTDPAILGSAVVDREVGFGIEDRITHAIDDGSLGFIRVHTGSVFVTQNSFVAPNTTEASIQRGIDVAVANDTVFVQGGALAYNGNLVIDTPLSLVGPNDAVSALVPGSRVQEATIAGSVTIAAAGNVTITGFTINDSVLNDTPSLINGGPVLVVENNFINTAGVGIDASFSQSLRVTGNDIASGGTGIFGFNIDGPVTVQGNDIVAGDQGINLDQIAGNILIGGGLPGEENNITATTYGIFAHNINAGSFTVRGNTITGASLVGIEVASIDGNVLIEDNTVTSLVGGSQGIYISNLSRVSTATATIQDNTVDVDGLGVFLESLQGAQQIEDNAITSTTGVGVRIDSSAVGAPAFVINNQIVSGASGVEFRNGQDNFTAQGNTITASVEAGILVLNSPTGDIVIGGPTAANGNTITVSNAIAGVEILDVLTGNVLLENNHVTSDSIGVYAANIGGTATLRRNQLDGTGLFGLEMSGVAGTVTIAGLMSTGSVRVDALNAIEVLPEVGYLATGIDASASIVSLRANQDDVGNQGFTQDSAAPIITTNDTDVAIVIEVGGTGSAAISVLKADTVTGQITVDAGGAITDNSLDLPADIANVEAERGLLIAGSGIGVGAGNADFDTAVSSLRAASATSNINIQERDDIELRSVIASTGAIRIDAGGVLTIQNHTPAEGATLQSGTGAVSNAPPLVRLNEQNPNDVILPGDRTQEVVGTYGGIEPADNLEQGENFTATVTWADGVTNTVTGLRAGDTLVWYIDEFGNGTPQITHNASGDGPITVFIQRTYPHLFLQTITGTEVEAQFTLQNDPNIVLTDSRYPSVSVFTNLNETAPLSIFTTVSKTDFQPPIMYIVDQAVAAAEIPPPPVTLEGSSSTPAGSTTYQEVALVREENVEQQATLYLVRVGPDGEEEQKVLLPLSDLQNIAGLLDRLRKLKMRSGLYRIYHQEPGLPPRKVLEFRKAGNFIGDPVREPGRGANPLDEQPGGAAPAPAPEGEQPGKAPEQEPGRENRNASLPPTAEQVALAIAEATPQSFSKAARLRRSLERLALAAP